MSGVPKKSSNKKSKKSNKINCCECLNPTDKGISKYKEPLCTITTNSGDHINSDLNELVINLQTNIQFILSVLKKKNVWVDDNAFNWNNAKKKSPLLKIIFNLLNSKNLRQHDTDFLDIMSKAIFTDQDHDFLDNDERTQFDETKCTELKTKKIIGLRDCLPRPTPLTINKIEEKYPDKIIYRSINPDPNKKLEGIEFMINDTHPPMLSGVIEDINEIYTITSYIDSAPCTSKNISSNKKCPYYKISNNIEFIITNLAFAFYQSFFKEFNDFAFYIKCEDNCSVEYNRLMQGAKSFTIIIIHKTSGNKYNKFKFEGIGGDEGDFTVPRIVKTLAVCNVLCPKIINLIEWLEKKCNIKDPNKIKRFIINLNVLMKGFGDFCQMFICLFLYFIEINIGTDAVGNAQICAFNKNIILTTCDSYLAQLAIICNCPHIIGHCTQEKFRWIYIDSNSIYLGKTIYRCWNDFYNIQLFVGNHNGADRKVRQLTNSITFNESCFCYDYGIKAIDKDTFINNLTKHLLSYHKQMVLFEKEFAILHQTNSKTFVLYLSPEDIRLDTLQNINTIYSNSHKHALSSDKRITFTFNTDYNLSTVYTDINIPKIRPLITTLYELMDTILTVRATCKFYEQVFTTKISNIVYVSNKKTQVRLTNSSSIPTSIEKEKLKTNLKTAYDIIIDELESLNTMTVPSSKSYEIREINFAEFESLLNKYKDASLNEKKLLETALLDPLIAWAKLKPYNKENSDDKDVIIFKHYFELPKFGNSCYFIQTLKKISNFLDLTASMIIMYKELLSNMETLKKRISNIKKIKFNRVDDKSIITTDEANLIKYISELKAKINVLQQKYETLKSYGYKDIISRAETQFKLIIEYLNNDANLTHLNNNIKDFLTGFVGNNNKIGILQTLVLSVFKNINTNIAIITTNCGGECVEDCSLNGAPGGPQPSLPDATATGALAGGYKGKRLNIDRSPFKGGVLVRDSFPDLLNLCENYEIQKANNDRSVINELFILYSDEFTNILLNNDVLTTLNGVNNSAIFKNYLNRLFYNYFTYILIWTFTRHMETNLAKFKHFVDCYRLLIIEKNRFVRNIIDQFAYYLSNNPNTEADAEALHDLFKLYEGDDLSILVDYQKMLELQTQRLLDFPHIFNEFLKTKLDLSSALAEHDRILSQQNGVEDINASILIMIPIYIEIFKTNFEMIYHFVSGYVISYQPLVNQNLLPENIESILLPIITSKKKEISKLYAKRKIVGDKHNNDRVAEVRKREYEKHNNDRERNKVLEKRNREYEKHYNRVLERRKDVNSSNDLDILIAEIEKLKDELKYLSNLNILCSKLSPELEKYSRINTNIYELYWRPDELPTIEKFQELHIITPPIFIGICQYFNDKITELTKQKKKNALLTTISKIDTKISGLKKTMSRPKNTQREKDTEKERGRERGKKSSRDSRRRRRSRSRESGKKDTKTAIEGSVDDIKVELKKLKDLKETKIDELARMNGGVSAIKSGNKPKTINTSDKVALTKYKLRVEQYKNKEFTTYFEKKLRVYINDSSINIYTIGIRKMKDILKNIYNITK
jgi:hypothetical protein